MSEIKKYEIALPEGENRIETGPIQFNDDWPGIFLRGDSAFHIANVLSQVHSGQKDALTDIQLKNIIDLLRECIL